MTLLGIALALFVVWLVFVTVFHVTFALVHLLIFAAVVIALLWLIRYITGGGPAV